MIFIISAQAIQGFQIPHQTFDRNLNLGPINFKAVDIRQRKLYLSDESV